MTKTTLFQKVAHTVSILALILMGVSLIGYEYTTDGWIFLLIGVLSLLFSERSFQRDIALIYLSLSILALTPITTDTSLSHMIQMGTMITLAVVLPYLITRFIYRTDTIQYGAFLTRPWTRGEWMWLAFTGVIGYFLIPYYLADTLSYQNWTVKLGWWEIFLLFLGTNALGIWDELFFVNTVLALLKKHIPFHLANLTQAFLFTSFLYELGFRGWAPWIIYPFALIQGYVFRETKNLTYIIALHLTLDLILFLALIHLHHPEWGLDIFIGSI
jgi:membrane protease YdiL (CAAX protease family)